MVNLILNKNNNNMQKLMGKLNDNYTTHFQNVYDSDYYVVRDYATQCSLYSRVLVSW